MDAQIALGEITAPAPHLVNLLVRFSLSRNFGHAFNPGPDTAPVGFGPDGADLNPIVTSMRVAAQKLRNIVYGVDDDIDIAVIIEIPKSTATRGRWSGDACTSLQRNILESTVAQIFVQQLSLRIPRFGLQLPDLGIDMPVADQDVGPAIVIHIEEPASPTKVLRMQAEAGGEGCVLKVGSPLIVIERGCVPCEIRLHHVEVAVTIVVGS